jgi:flagellar M-ring protein FliF
VDLLHIFNRVKSAAAALSPQQLTTLAIAFVAVVGLTIGSAYWLNVPTYGVLFADMDSETAASVVTKLKNDKVAYLLDDGGRTVRVPASRVDELRLDMASQGMPTSGRVGFEIFDRTAFGVTDFLEHVNYRRALEGELARTIASVGDVASARVHIAIPRESLFANQEQPAKASVVLKLRTNRPLPASTVNAITGLVAASVESLRPEAVVVIDNFGRSLAHASANADDPAGGPQLEHQQGLERDMAARVVALLDPILGAGHVRVNVNAQLDPGSKEETEERWDPSPVVRSRQSVSQVAGGGTATQGVAGTRANLPPDPKAPKPPETTLAAVPPAQHTAETTNYELGRVTTHRLQPRGKLTRLSVAVVVDDEREVASENGKSVRRSKPRSAPEIQKVHDLVAASVGLDTERGDQLTVENIAFEETPTEDVPPAPKWQQYGPQVFDAARLLGIVAVIAFAFFGVIRPALNRVMATATLPAGAIARAGTAGPPAAALRTVEDLEGEIDAELRAAANLGTARRLPVLTRRVAAMTQREPENTARLLRTWLSEEER